jgi:hypothetical protein
MMNIVKSMYISLAVALIILGVPSSLAFASIVDYNDETEQEEQCKEESDYDHLCNGSTGVTGIPFCDKYNGTRILQQFPNITGNRCFDRMANQVNFCETFDDLTSTYEYCRKVPGSEEFYEYLKTGGPDESCLFDVSQIKCQPDPLTDECPPGFGNNEDGRCFPAPLGEWRCPVGYHNEDDDESGQCYPNSEGCEYDNFVLLTDTGRSDRCAYLGYICGEGNENSHPRCEEFLEEQTD